MNQPAMVGSDVVARVLAISVPTVNRLARKGEGLPFPAYHFGRSVRFKRSDVEEFVGEPLVLAS